MENLKIRVNTEQESKEAQELFFELGYEWYGSGKSVSYLECITSGEFRYLVAWKPGCFSKHIIQMGCGKEEAREVSLPHLRDMVVLKRNDPKDATHIDDYNDKWLVNSLGSFNWCDANWTDKTIDVLGYALKPIEKEMKEYLAKMQDGSYKLIPSKMSDGDIEVPEWANYVYDNDPGVCFLKGFIEYNHPLLIWQRESLNDKVASAEVARQKHSHYKKDVSHLKTIDVYRVLGLFDVDSHEVGHAIKKLLCSGQRGAKDHKQDIQEAVDSLNRHLEMLAEDEAS